MATFKVIEYDEKDKNCGTVYRAFRNNTPITGFEGPRTALQKVEHEIRPGDVVEHIYMSTLRKVEQSYESFVLGRARDMVWDHGYRFD